MLVWALLSGIGMGAEHSNGLTWTIRILAMLNLVATAVLERMSLRPRAEKHMQIANQHRSLARKCMVLNLRRVITEEDLVELMTAVAGIEDKSVAPLNTPKRPESHPLTSAAERQHLGASQIGNTRSAPPESFPTVVSVV